MKPGFEEISPKPVSAEFGAPAVQDPRLGSMCFDESDDLIWSENSNLSGRRSSLRCVSTGILRYVSRLAIHSAVLQKLLLAPPPPDCPPPKRTSGLLVCGPGVIEWGVSGPNTVAPTFIQSLSFPDRRAAVKP